MFEIKRLKVHEPEALLALYDCDVLSGVRSDEVKSKHRSETQFAIADSRGSFNHGRYKRNLNQCQIRQRYKIRKARKTTRVILVD